MTPDEISARLSGRKSFGGWTAKCPAHEDKTASLSISEGNDGRVLLHCHAGCPTEAIAGAAGLSMSDLFATDSKPKQRPQIVAEYDYLDEAGERLYQVVRLEPKSFRQRKPEGSGWNWSVKGVRRVLYRLPELLKLKPGTAVFVVEGEKDADALVKIGLQATTNAGGADKWSADFAQQLAEFRVVILPDNDDPGRKHAKRVADSLEAIEAKHAVLALPDLPDKGDVSDWIANGGTREQLVSLVGKLFAKAPPRGFASSASRMHVANEQRLESIKHVMPYNISYLDDELLGIHPHDIVIVMASTGAGKTTLGSILAQKGVEDGKRIRFFALEAYENEIEIRMLYREISRLAGEAGVWQQWMTQQLWIKRGIEELDQFTARAMENLEKRLGHLETYYRGSKFDREDIRREFTAAKGKVDMIILDHLHYIDSDGPNENSELKKVIEVIRDCGQDLAVPVIVIAHIRKKGGNEKDQWIPRIDDLHGSSAVTKIATTIIAVAPATEEEFLADEHGIAHTFMAVLKDRIGGNKGYAALMRFDLSAMEYRHNYRLCKRTGSGTAKFVKRNPAWAKNAMSVRVDEPPTNQENFDDF
jgi:hypothetical protein